MFHILIFITLTLTQFIHLHIWIHCRCTKDFFVNMYIYSLLFSSWCQSSCLLVLYKGVSQRSRHQATSGVLERRESHSGCTNECYHPWMLWYLHLQPCKFISHRLHSDQGYFLIRKSQLFRLRPNNWYFRSTSPCLYFTGHYNSIGKGITEICPCVPALKRR